MSRFVLDASTALSWCFEDERNPAADAVLESLRESSAVVPSIWPLEVANALLTAERRKRLSKGDAERFLRLMMELPLEADQQADLKDVLRIARASGLSAYDAAYLELAVRRSLPLASGDRRLRNAGPPLGVLFFAAG